MIIYHLYHRHFLGENNWDEKSIGYYIAYKQVRKIIESYKKLPGFRDAPDSFHIELLDFPDYSGELYTLWFIHETKEIDIEINCGYYSSYNSAQEAYTHLLKKRPYSEAPEDLTIEKLNLNINGWGEGYC